MCTMRTLHCAVYQSIFFSPFAECCQDQDENVLLRIRTYILHLKSSNTYNTVVIFVVAVLILSLS